MKPVSMTLSDL